MSESRHFLEVGHLWERTTKTGNPYLTDMIGDQQVFLFLQEDGSWKVFIRADTLALPAAAEPPAHTADQRTYEETLAGVEVPDYDEPVRRRSLREHLSSHRAASQEPDGRTARPASRMEDD